MKHAPAVSVIITDGTGRKCATGYDDTTARRGGETLAMAQEFRARRQALSYFFRFRVSYDVFEVMTLDHMQSIFNAMAETCGHRLEVRQHQHE